MRLLSRSFLTLVVCLIAATLGMAQTSGTIQGVVSDNSGAVIPGSEIRATNTATGTEHSATSNEVGFYMIPGVPPGPYTVICTSEGMAPSERPGIQMEVGNTMRLDFALNVGSVAEVIEVSAAAQLIQSEKTEVGQVIDSKRILEMPLNGRNYLELARFSVGVLPSRELGKGTRHGGQSGGEGGMLAMGMRAAQTNVLLDGSDNSSRNSGGALGFQAQAVKPSVDAVGEFRVITNNTSAEYGFRNGAKVIVSTKSGTNDLHGSAYWFVRNDKFDGTNFMANKFGNEKPTLRRNTYGGTIGGPMIKNKLFGFFSFQGYRDRAGQSFTSSVPSAAAKGGDFSAQPDPDRQIFDPLTLNNGVRQAFPGFIIPSSRFDPVAKNAIDLYPDPNVSANVNGRNNYFFSPSESTDHDQYDFKVDWNVNSKNRAFGRYSYRDEFVNRPGPLPTPAIGGSGETVDLPGNNWAGGLSTTVGTTMFNEARFGYTHFPSKFDIPDTGSVTNDSLGVKGAPGDALDDGLGHGYALFLPGGWRGMGPRGFWPNVNHMDNLQLSDNFTIIKNNHSIKFGAEFRRIDIPRSPSRHRRGRFNFNGVYTAEEPNSSASRGATGASMADFLLGWANNGRWGWPNGEEYVSTYWGFFVQDDWKITNRLTLNLGMRYELFGVPTFPDPQSHDLNSTVNRFLTQINGRPFGEGEGLPVNAPGAWGEEEFLPHFVSPTSSSDCGNCKRDKNNFAPRVGLAYRVDDKTVIRAGAGLFYAEHDSVQSETSRFYTGAPNSNEFDNAQPRPMSSFFVQEGFPASTRTGLPRAGLNANTNADGTWPQMYAAQWFFDVQRELGFDTLLTIGYNGTAGSQAPSSIQVNRPLTPHPTIRHQDRRIRPFFNNVSQRGTQFNNTSYQSLTVKAEKRFTRGLTFLSSFTWAHNIDVQNENLTTGTTAQQLWTYAQHLDRGNSSLDRRLNFVISVVYELPFGTGKQYLNSGAGKWILGDWQIGGIFSASSGTWDSHTVNQNTTNVGGANRGIFLRNPNLPSSERTVDRWLDTNDCRPLGPNCAVQPGEPGVLDTAGRNMIEGPGFVNLDFSLSRRFMMPWEGHSLQFRFESFNFTNTANFGRPNTGFGGANLGKITTAHEPRRIQFALKYVF
jgi:carboxypeptidase family protein/TonB-dependent receptor-like protein